jgi:serine protease Do
MARLLLMLTLSLLLCQLPASADPKTDYSKLKMDGSNSPFKQAWDKSHGQDGPLADPRPILTDVQIAEKAEQSTAVLHIPIPKSKPPEEHSATGFFVAKGVLATNHHVIASGIQDGLANYKLNGSPMLCALVKVIAADPAHDVALVQVISKTMFTGAALTDAPILPLANKFDTLHKGQKVFLTGNPHGYDLTASQGQISAFRSWQQIIQREQGKISHLDSLPDGDIIQYAAPTSPGSSGSAVLNDRGEVIGVHMSGPVGVTKGEKAENLNLATRVVYLKKLMQEAGLYPAAGSP